jgi:hypothetical protein
LDREAILHDNRHGAKLQAPESVGNLVQRGSEASI